MRSRVVCVWVFAAALWACGCGKDDVQKVQEGHSCDSDANCNLEQTCVKANAEQGKVCARICKEGLSAPAGFYCGESWRPISCEGADERECESCGCADSAELCERGVGCHARAAVGEACVYNGECESGNCSNFAGVCRVAVGTACTADNCDICWTLPDWSWCSRECDSSDCGSRGICLGRSDEPYTCRPTCSGPGDTRCPGSCETVVSDPSAQFCVCSGCERLEPPHQLGELCRHNSQCESEFCLAALEECRDSYISCTYLGVCSSVCTTSAECESGGRCSDGACLMPCDPMGYDACRAGSCVPSTVAEGASESLCNPLRENGLACRGDWDCQSGFCDTGACSGTATLGEACVAQGDCSGSHCCDGKCASACQN